jgi:hypothetical protein
MKVLGYILCLLAFASYARLVMTIRRLVSESRELNAKVAFNWFWWLPAWSLHREFYPGSSVRRQIVVGFLVTFLLMAMGMACIAVAIVHTAHPAAEGQNGKDQRRELGTSPRGSRPGFATWSLGGPGSPLADRRATIWALAGHIRYFVLPGGSLWPASLRSDSHRCLGLVLPQQRFMRVGLAAHSRGSLSNLQRRDSSRTLLGKCTQLHSHHSRSARCAGVPDEPL